MRNILRYAVGGLGMKKAYAINGGPRKDGTTARILAAALEGAKEAGAETKMINLYDLDFSGCIGCAARCLRGKATINAFYGIS